MGIAESIFNIRVVSSDGIPAALLKAGQITILGKNGELSGNVQRTFAGIFRSVDLHSTYYRYDLKSVDGFEDLAEYLDCNIIAAMPDPVGGMMEAVIATARPEELGLALVAVINEVEKRTIREVETFMSLFATVAPDEYRSAVERLFERFPRRNNYGAAIPFTGHGEGVGENRIAPQTFQNPGNGSMDKDEEICYESVIASRLHVDPYASCKAIENEMTKYKIDVLDNRQLLGILQEMSNEYKHIFQKIHLTKLKIASKFSIRVKPWSSSRQEFKDYFRFCTYIVDENGTERPVKFSSRPSYCIFMMYVLDRFRRGKAATPLSFGDDKTKEEFRRLFSAIFHVDSETIDKLCNEIISRPTGRAGVLRKGRYDEYIKDINDSIERIVGFPDSASLMVGHGKILEIPQNKIEVDEKLKIFEFA